MKKKNHSLSRVPGVVCKKKKIVYYRFKILFTMFSVVDHKRQNSAAGECGKFAALIVRALSGKKRTRRIHGVG